MRALLTATVAALLLIQEAGAQTISYFNQGFLRQPSQAADVAYLGLTGLNTLGGLNGIVYGDGTAFHVVTIGAGISFAGGVLSAPGGGGTVTTFSSGNLSPLFNTSVATANTTPALSFSQISQSAETFFAGPISGAAASPTFRFITNSDLTLGLATNSPFIGAFLRSSGSGDDRQWTYNGGSLTNLNAGSMVGQLTPDHVGPFTNHSDVVPSTLQPGDIIAYNGSGSWTNGQPAGGGGTSLPGLLVRPVSALPSGTLQAPTWPDDNTYYFDEDFDVWLGSSSGQFGRWKWTASANGGGGGVINVSSNQPPYFGIIALQSPTTTGNTFVISQYGTTGILPYGNLGITSNWLFHAVFLLGNSNQGSIYRLGLEDFGFNLAATSMNPSNCIMLRWDKNKADKEAFVFEARSNAIVQTNFSTIRPATNVFFKVTFMCTNSGTVNCSVNGESWVTLTNIPIAPLCITAMDATTNATAQNLWLDRLSFMASSMNR